MKEDTEDVKDDIFLSNIKYGNVSRRWRRKGNQLKIGDPTDKKKIKKVIKTRLISESLVDEKIFNMNGAEISTGHSWQYSIIGSEV